MKTTLKYITLLIFGGVIIPLYQQTAMVKPVKVSMPDTIESGNACHFYFLHDVAAKLFPVITFFR